MSLTWIRLADVNKHIMFCDMITIILLSVLKHIHCRKSQILSLFRFFRTRDIFLKCRCLLAQGQKQHFLSEAFWCCCSTYVYCQTHQICSMQTCLQRIQNKDNVVKATFIFHSITVWLFELFLVCIVCLG